MPKIEKVFTLEVTPEQFLRACSTNELIELDLLLASPRYQDKMKGSSSTANENSSTELPNSSKSEIQLCD